MATMKDIARMTGLSESTVSRVLNNRPYIKQATRERVLQAAKELDYRPNALARGLARNRTQVIGLVIGRISNLFFGEVIRGIEEVVNLHGYSLILCVTGMEPRKELHYIDVLRQQKVDGMIFMSGFFPHELQKAIVHSGIPTIAISRLVLQEEILSVRIDDFKEAKAATDYLISLGHQRVGFISGPLQDPTAGASRLEGYKQSLVENNIAFDPALVQESDFRLNGGYEGMLRLLTLRRRPTAIFAANDEMAIGAIKACKEKGLQVPRDLAVVGFDDTLFAAISDPPLTTVAQPIYQLGATAAQMLIQFMEEGSVPERMVLLPCQLRIRESCGAKLKLLRSS